MADYTYSVSVDFGNDISSTCLKEEILNSSISSTLDAIIIIDDEVTISFLTSLSTGDETTLNNIVATHNSNCESQQQQDEEDEGSAGNIVFASDGTSGSGRYLDLHHNIPSNKSPAKFTYDVKLRSISIALNNTETGSIEIYKDGSLVHTFSVSSQSEKCEIGLDILFEKDTKISAKVSSGSFKDPVLILWFNKE